MRDLITYGSVARRGVRIPGRVLHPETGVLSLGPDLDECVEHTRLIAALSLEASIPASAVDVAELPDCHAAIREAKAAFGEQQAAAGDAALNEAAQILRDAGWTEPEIGSILSYLIAR